MTTSFAMLFPGQGSQFVGMLAPLAQQFPQLLSTFTEASQLLGYDTWELCQHDPEQRLDTTQYTQPLLLCASVALWRLWRELGGALPHAVAGHSLGEFSALVVAESMTFQDALRVVALRGQLMQQAVAPGAGAMAAILGLSDESVAEVCEEVVRAQSAEWVAPANFNAPLQVVISGHSTAVQQAMSLAKQRGAKLTKLLAVSVPSHSRLLQSAVPELQQFLQNIPLQTPKFPVIHNVDAASHDDPIQIRQALITQLCAPVRWTDSINHMITQGITRFVECGANRVLAGLNKRINTSITTYALETPEVFSAALQAIK